MGWAHPEEKYGENTQNSLWKLTRRNEANRETKSKVHEDMLETERGDGRLFVGLSTSLAKKEHDSKYVKKRKIEKYWNKISAVKYTFKRNHNEQECEQF